MEIDDTLRVYTPKKDININNKLYWRGVTYSEEYLFGVERLARGCVDEYFTNGPLYQVVSKTKSPTDFQKIAESLSDLLTYKNEKYGNSALSPLEVFNGKTKVGQRIDDKLARVKNSGTLRKNDVADLMGYLMLVCVENGWESFDEFKD